MAVCIGTIANVADNSGASKARIIQILGGNVRRPLYVGDIVVVSLIKVASRIAKKHGSGKLGLEKVKDGAVFTAVVVRGKLGYVTKDGIHIVFEDNAVALLNKDGSAVGTIISGPVARKAWAACPGIRAISSEVI